MKERVCARVTCAPPRHRFVPLCLPLMKEKPKTKTTKKQPSENGTVDTMGAGQEARAGLVRAGDGPPMLSEATSVYLP